MKTNKKILLGVLGFVIVYLTLALLVMRNEIQSIVKKAEMINNYRQVEVSNFDGLNFAGKWNVNINRSRTYKVELAVEDSSGLLPTLKNIGGTLYFTMDSTYKSSIEVKILMPSITMLKAVNGTHINIKNFKADSLIVELEDGSFIGNENEFIYTSFKTSGNSTLQLTDDPFK